MSTRGRFSVKNSRPAHGASQAPLVGHDERIRSFTRLASNNKLSHAYLFFGDQGVGKRTFAHSFATFLESGQFAIGHNRVLMDAVVLSPSERGSIGIDAVRGVRHFLSQTPVVSPRRTVIVDSAETLTLEAQSALLKIVEEPPSRALLFFITFNSLILVPPLRSRLVAVYFPRLGRAALQQALSSVWKLTPKRSTAIAARSFGRIGYALLLANLADDSLDSVDLAHELERAAVELRWRNLKEHHTRISRLLERAALVRRYTVNEPLQRKAMQLLAAS